MSDEPVAAAAFGINNQSYRQIALQGFVISFVPQIALKGCILLQNFPVTNVTSSGTIPQVIYPKYHRTAQAAKTLHFHAQRKLN